MHKLSLPVIALALFCSGATAMACLNDSITSLSEGYFTRIYQELKVKRTSATYGEMVVTGAGVALLVGGTLRMLIPQPRKSRARRLFHSSPRTGSRGAGEGSATRSANRRQSASRNSRTA